MASIITTMTPANIKEDRIQYTIGMASPSKDDIAPTIPAHDFKDLCESLSIYECIPDDQFVKPYFDIEVKPDHCAEGEGYIDCTSDLVQLAKSYIEKVFPNAHFCVLDSSSPSYISCMDGREKFINSAHIIVSNYQIMKRDMIPIVKDLNAMARSSKHFYQDWYRVLPEADLFDKGVYDDGRKLRSAYAVKDNCNPRNRVTENRPMTIVEGCFEQSVISTFFDEDSTVCEPRDFSPITVVGCPKEHVPTFKTVTVTAVESKYLEMIRFIRIDPKDRKVWLRVCSCLKQNGFTQDDWFQFCEDNHLNMDKEKQELFEKIQDSYPLSIYYLRSLAKKNEVPYKAWTDKWKPYFISSSDLQNPYECANVITPELKQSLVRCNEGWYILDNRNLWVKVDDPSFGIITTLRKFIDYSETFYIKKRGQLSSNASDNEAELKTLQKQLEIYTKMYMVSNSSGFYSPLKNYLKALLKDDNFTAKLDANAGEMVFRNGVMDLHTMTFREGIEPIDYVTATIPYDYVVGRKDTPDRRNFLKGIVRKIMNNNEEHMEYLLSLIGYSFVGVPHLEKSLYFCVDRTFKSAGDNGKTLLFDILSTIFPNYVLMTNKTFLENDNKKIHKQLATVKGKRLVWLDEFNEKQVNAELMKVVADGHAIENEVMYGTCESIPIHFKLWTLTNHMPNINAKDTAVYNRYKQLSFGSHFDRSGDRKEENPEALEFIADKTLGDTIKQHYVADMIDLVMEYAHKYIAHGLPSIPDQFKRDTKATQNANDEFKCWFEENKLPDGAGLRVAEKELIDRSGLHPKKVREGMTRLGFKYNKDLSKMGKDKYSKSYKGGYEGVGLVAEEIPDDDMLDEV